MFEEITTRRVIVTGHVQGVFFRAGMKTIADKNNTVGWVRNLDDGSVEALLQGKASDLEKVIAWCRTGPPGARVEEVSVSKVNVQKSYRNFVILH